MNITILGAGNPMRSDDGFGIRVIRRMAQEYDLPDGVALVDGSTSGFNLVPVIMGADHLFIIDTVVRHGQPGTIHRLEGETIAGGAGGDRKTLHQAGLPDVLAFCRTLERMPPTVIFGVEPADIETIADCLIPPVAAAVDIVINLIISELKLAGFHILRKTVD